MEYEGNALNGQPGSGLTHSETAFTVNEKSAKAGIDFYQKRIDRHYFDKVKPLEDPKPAPKPVAGR